MSDKKPSSAQSMQDKYKIINRIEEEKKGEITLEVEISADLILSFKDQAIRDYKADIEMPGFRKGHVPDNKVIEKVGEMAIYEKCTYKALNNLIPMIIATEKIDSLTQPSISVTKLVPNTPAVFKMTMILMPTVTLPDYKKIAKAVKAIKNKTIEDKEVDEYIDYIRTQRRDSIAMAENKKIDKTAPLPELDETFVKSLGDFKDVNDFRTQLKENMTIANNTKEQERRRLEIMQNIITETSLNVPDVLIDQEIDHMMNKFRYDIEQMKMMVEDYLKEIKKSEEDLKKEWRVDAEKRVKMNLILPKIAASEKLIADPEQVQKEIAHIKEHDANINDTHALMYVTNVLTNEEVFKFLENIK